MRINEKNKEEREEKKREKRKRKTMRGLIPYSKFSNN